MTSFLAVPFVVGRSSLFPPRNPKANWSWVRVKQRSIAFNLLKLPFGIWSIGFLKYQTANLVTIGSVGFNSFHFTTEKDGLGCLVPLESAATRSTTLELTEDMVITGC